MALFEADASRGRMIKDGPTQDPPREGYVVDRVEYGFCYPVNRSFTVCHPLTF